MNISNISYETLASVMSLIVAVIAVIISAFSAIYSARLVELEKAKYKFDQDRYLIELQEKFVRQRPLVIIESLELQEHLAIAGKKRETKKQYVYRTGIIYTPRGNRLSRILGAPPPKSKISVDLKGKNLEGKTVNLTRITVSAELTIANRGDVPLWIKWIAIGLRLRPQLPTFVNNKKYSIIQGYLEWGKLIAGAKHLETLDNPRWYNSDLLLAFLFLRKWLRSTPEIKYPMIVTLIDTISSQQVFLEEPILIEPGSFRKWRVWIDLSPRAIEFLESHHFEPYSINATVFWGDKNTSEESRIERFFYQFGDFGFHHAFAKVKWNNSKGAHRLTAVSRDEKQEEEK